MAKYILSVHSNAAEGREDEYNDWYNNIHLGEVLAVPGFVAAQRFAYTGQSAAGDAPAHKFLAIYELETDDPQASLDALGEEVSSGRMNISDAIRMDDVAAALYGPISGRVTS